MKESDSQNLLNTYTKEIPCTYRGRRYYVRDNGAVYRLSKDGKSKSKYDEIWTFGTFDESSGYMLIGNERIHRIVCTAFHGEPEGDRNIVDHFDTNRRNNRAENLHWVSKLENMLNNPITQAKIEVICGSIEAFVENPYLLFGHEKENPNFKWMKTVSPEEAKASYNRWIEWANLPIEERKNKGGGPGNWLYDTSPKLITYHCRHIKCPQDCSFKNFPFTISKEIDPFKYYIDSLKPGEDFLYTIYYKTIVEKVHIFEDDHKARIISKRINKNNGDIKMPWQVYEIWVEGQYIVIEHVATYGKKQYAQCEKALTDLSIFKLDDWKFRKTEQINLPYPTISENTPELVIPHPIIETKEYHTAPNIIQINWKTPTEFPLCPTESTEDGLSRYMANLKKGEIYCRNRYGESTLVDFAYNKKGDEIIVMTHTPNPIKEWGLNKIYYEDGIFVHESLHMYFHEEGARKYFTIARGLKWTGGDVFDDFC